LLIHLSEVFDEQPEPGMRIPSSAFLTLQPRLTGCASEEGRVERLAVLVREGVVAKKLALSRDQNDETLMTGSRRGRILNLGL
jgi:hypothetical protein